MPKVPKYNEPEPVEPRSLKDIARELGEVYFIEKDAKAEKDKYRKEFFDEATESFAQEELARKTVEVPVAVADPDSYVAQYFPGWRVVTHDERAYTLEEDPAWLNKAVVVPVDDSDDVDGYVITRTIRSGSQLLDDERLRKERPALWLSITRPRDFGLLCSLVYGVLISLDEIGDFDEMLAVDEVNIWAENNDWPREPIPPDELDEDTIEEIKPYFFEGPKTAALNVRYAKPDELDA